MAKKKLFGQLLGSGEENVHRSDIIPGISLTNLLLSSEQVTTNIDCSSSSNASPKRRFSLILFLVSFLAKLRHLLNAVHYLFFGHSKHIMCSCSGTKGLCRYSNEDLDADDYFHALKNHHENVPECSKEPYLLNGYVLPHKPWRYYLKVLWIPNNEAMNVWTHLIPSIYFMLLLQEYVQIEDLRTWPLLFITTGAIVLTLCSSIAHMFHSRSNYHHCCLFILDYFGITMFAFCSTSAHFFVSAELSFYARIGWYNLFVLMLIAAVGFYFCSLSQTGRKDHNTHHRQLKIWANAVGYLYGIIPLVHRLLTSSNDDPAFFYVIVHLLCFLSSPILYASDFPQNYWPGRFDIVGHSHQIFHIIIATGCYCDIKATSIDVLNGRWSTLSKQVDYPPMEVAGLVVATLVAYCILVAFYFSRKLKQCFKHELNSMFGYEDAHIHKNDSCKSD